MTRVRSLRWRTSVKVDVEIRSYGLGPGSWHIYSAMGTSPDGDIYTGVCDYAFAFKLADRPGGAHLVRYDPGEDRMYDLGDMQDITGQRDRDKACAQSKIHTPIVFSWDGKALFGTHSVERDFVPPEHKDRFTEGYPGGHWVSYDPSLDKMEDLGIAVPGESLMGLTVDPKGRKLCATTHKKSMLVEYDIAERVTQAKGSIGNYPTRTVAYLSDGAAYTFDDKGYLLRYDPGKGVIEKLGPRVPNGGREADLISVFALCTDPARKRLYGLSTLLDQGDKMVRLGGYFFEYAMASRGPGELKDLGRGGIAVDQTSTSESELYHAITHGKDGKVYYIAPQMGKPAHLVCYDPKKDERRDCGEMWSRLEGVYVFAVFAACTGNDGRLYFGGLLKSDTDPKWVHDASLMIVDPRRL